MQKPWSLFFSAWDPWTGSTIWIRMVGAPAAAVFPWTNNLYCSVCYRHLLCLHACSVAKVSSSLLLVRCTLAAIAGQLTAQRSDSAAGSPFLQVRVSFTSFTLQKAIIFLSASSRAASCMQVLSGFWFCTAGSRCTTCSWPCNCNCRANRNRTPIRAASLGSRSGVDRQQGHEANCNYVHRGVMEPGSASADKGGTSILGGD